MFLMLPYDEMLPMSSGGVMAARIPEVTDVFIKKGKLSIHMHCA
jgi:hypothetical protein